MYALPYWSKLLYMCSKQIAQLYFGEHWHSSRVLISTQALIKAYKGQIKNFAEVFDKFTVQLKVNGIVY